MWLRVYLQAVLAVIISFFLYGGLLPRMVSAPDTLLVLAGFALALIWPALLVWFFRKRVRKMLSCVKF